MVNFKSQTCNYYIIMHRCREDISSVVLCVFFTFSLFPVLLFILYNLKPACLSVDHDWCGGYIFLLFMKGIRYKNPFGHSNYLECIISWKTWSCWKVNTVSHLPLPSFASGWMSLSLVYRSSPMSIFKAQ